MKKGIILSTLVAALLIGSSYVKAEPVGTFGVNLAWNQPILKRIKHVDEFGDVYYTFVKEEPSKCVKKETHRAAQSFKKAPKEITSGLNATILAINYLKNNNIKDAKKELKKAITLFDKALKAEPNFKLVALDQIIDVYELKADAKQIKADITAAQKLLKSYKTQDARALLMPLEDEIDITTHYIPMDTYPKAIKDALNLLNKGKKKEALNVLLAGLDTIVAVKVVIPIPLLRAQEFLENASKVAKENPKKAYNYLQMAKKEIYKAVILGYTSKHSKEYASLYKELTNIQKELKANHETAKLFEHAKKSAAKLLNKTRLETQSSDNVWQGTAKEHKEAQEEELNDKLRFIQKMEADIF